MQPHDLAPVYFHNGINFEAYNYFGSHPSTSDGTDGAIFRVWAPHAVSVHVEGDFNNWDKSSCPMTMLGDLQTWELFIPNVQRYQCYKYVIETKDGSLLEKADPFSVHCETPPSNCSRFYDISGYQWHDSDWMNSRSRDLFNSPINIYEVHLGSWRKHEDGNPLSYLELAEQLPSYVKEMGYTHIELMPVSEYPFDGSWGYQVTGYFAPTSRYGTPSDFMHFIDRCHKEGIGVILDWVPAHFPKDSFGLFEFDGDKLYEDPNPYRMEHEEWGTRIFDFGRPEIQSFLISSAANWFDNYHADGIRVDAVASMLYLDYGREQGKWRPNSNGGRENLEAVAFLRKLNEYILTRFPGVIMAAEESTSWPMVTAPPSSGGLGFNFKWNMGWMNDMLEYISCDPLFRKGSHDKLTFSMMYAFSENFILPISHDEVVHGKKSMISKLPGTYEEQFAGLRTFYAYMYAHPGKKLTFMGNEFAQFIEWRYKEELDWLLLDYPAHRKFRDYIKKLNHLYLNNPEFWAQDCSWDGFRWVNPGDNGRNCLSFIRYNKNGEGILVIINFSASKWSRYIVGCPVKGNLDVLLDSSSEDSGGSCEGMKQVEALPIPWMSFPCSVTLDLEPLSALYIKLPNNTPREDKNL